MRGEQKSRRNEFKGNAWEGRGENGDVDGGGRKKKREMEMENKNTERGQFYRLPFFSDCGYGPGYRRHVGGIGLRITL